MSTVEILQKARDLISDPARWTQDAYARDEHGREGAEPNDCDAVCFCSLGAIYRTTSIDIAEYLPYSVTLNLAQEMQAVETDTRGKCERYIADFNDGHTHAEVLAAFDRAIEKAKASAGAA